jgi:hypothetical protein
MLGMNQITAVFASGYIYNSYLHFMKSHLNCKPMIDHKIENVDKVFCIKAKDSEDILKDMFVFSSEDQWTSVNTIENQKFQDKTEEFEIDAGQFTLLCSNIKDGQILFVFHKNITLLKNDGKTVVASIDKFEEIEDIEIKMTWLYAEQELLFWLSNHNELFIYSVNEEGVTPNNELNELFNINSEVIKKKEPIISVSVLTHRLVDDDGNLSGNRMLFFICSSNGLFEIFDSSKRVFKCRENIKGMPSLVTDCNEKDIIGTRWFTDLTVPLKYEIDQSMHKNIGHSIREIHYHTFDNKSIYIFAILLSGQVQIYKQITQFGKASQIRFKKVIIPELIGKHVNIDFQEYSFKQKDDLGIKRQRSHTITCLDSQKEYKKLVRTQIKILSNKMIYIKDFGLIIHEMKGKLFAYSLSSNQHFLTECKSIESWNWSYSNQYAFIVSDSFLSVKILIPQREFNFGTKDQIFSDYPQTRYSNSEYGTFKKIALYRTLKYEEFVVAGWFKQSENKKEVEVPAPPEKAWKDKVEEIVVEEEKPKPFMIEKPGFPPLKPIIPVSLSN